MNVMNTNFVKALFGFAALLMLAGPASAQDVKIGVVNIPLLMDRSPQTKVAFEALQEEFAPRQRTILALQKELQDKDENYKKDRAVLSEAERRNIEKDLREGQRDLVRMNDEFNEDFNLRRNEELGNIQRGLLKEVQDYAQQEGFDLVVGDGVLYASEAVNITGKVLAAMEANFKAGQSQ